MNPYSEGLQDGRTWTKDPLFGAAFSYRYGEWMDRTATQVAVGRFTEPVFKRRYWAGVRAAASETPPEGFPATNPESTMSDKCILTAFVAALTAQATATQNLADAIKGAGNGSNIVPISAGKPTGAGTPAAGAAKPAGGGGNTAALEKARAAQKLKKEQEAAAAAAAAAGTSDDDDLSLLDGGNEGDVVTLEELRALGMQILKAKKQAEMKKALEGLGASALASLDESQYPAAKEALQAILL